MALYIGTIIAVIDMVLLMHNVTTLNVVITTYIYTKYDYEKQNKPFRLAPGLTGARQVRIVHHPNRPPAAVRTDHRMSSCQA